MIVPQKGLFPNALKTFHSPVLGSSHLIIYTVSPLLDYKFHFIHYNIIYTWNATWHITGMQKIFA